jgi:hypothetical protein
MESIGPLWSQTLETGDAGPGFVGGRAAFGQFGTISCDFSYRQPTGLRRRTHGHKGSDRGYHLPYCTYYLPPTLSALPLSLFSYR